MSFVALSRRLRYKLNFDARMFTFYRGPRSMRVTFEQVDRDTRWAERKVKRFERYCRIMEKKC